LDALTKSGELLLYDTTVHVVLASTHTFEKSVFHTVTRDNIVRTPHHTIQTIIIIVIVTHTQTSRYTMQNPIEKCEASAAIVAAALHGVEPRAVVADAHRARIGQFTPKLLATASAAKPALKQ
jgi:hypothetical protein